MGNIDPTLAMAIIIVLMTATSIILNIVRTIHGLKPKPSAETSLGTIATRIGSIERELEATKERLARHEDKISRQIGALHERINDVFGALREMNGTLKTHMEQRDK